MAKMSLLRLRRRGVVAFGIPVAVPALLPVSGMDLAKGAIRGHPLNAIAVRPAPERGEIARMHR